MQPIKLQITVPIVLGLLLSFSAKANATDFNLGVAANYNLFATSGSVDETGVAQGDITQISSDTEGAVAAAGNITLSNFSVGALLPSNYSGDALVAGGSLTLSDGYINGNAVYGTTYSISPQYSVGALSFTQGTPINFTGTNGADAYLQNASTAYSLKTANGTTTQTGGTITLQGTSSSGTDVFNVTQAQLASATVLNIDADPNATVIINVSGTSPTLNSYDITINGTSEQNVLYNFYQATTLTASAVNIPGTVLAPLAAFSFNNGQANGNVVVASFDGDAQINDPALSTPEPGSLVGLGAVALLSSFCLRRKAKKV